MAYSRYLVLVLFVKLVFYIGCCGNEPMDSQSMKTKLLELENEILRLKATVCGRDYQMTEISELRTTSQQNEAFITEIQHKISELSGPSTRQVVAFRSFLTNNIESVPLGQIIIFDRVDLNVGNGYNRFNGVFTALYNGTYSFSMFQANPTGKIGHMYLIQSDGSKRTVIEYMFAGHTRNWNIGTASTVAYLNAGESVWG